MTSSTKPEVNKVFFSSEEDRATATGSMYRKFVKLANVVFEMMQTGTQTRRSQYVAYAK